jgi:hypothetical protein
MSDRKRFQKRAIFLDKSITIRELIFIAVLLLCLSSFISPPVALLVGIGVAQFIGHPFIHLNHRITQILLSVKG